MLVCPDCHRKRQRAGVCEGVHLHRQVGRCEMRDCGRTAKIVDCRNTKKTLIIFDPRLN